MIKESKSRLSSNRLFVYIFLLRYVSTMVQAATSTTSLEIGYFDVNFNSLLKYLPINGSFVYRLSSTSLENNSSLLNVMVENRSLAVCNYLDLFKSTSHNVNNHIWKSVKWTLSFDEFSCSAFGDDDSNSVANFQKHLSHNLTANDSIFLRIGSERFSGCLTNFTIHDADIVSFKCVQGTTTAIGHGDVLFENERVSIRHAYNVKCFACEHFPTPGPFLSTNMLENQKNFTSFVDNSTTNSSLILLKSYELNSTSFNVSVNSTVVNETELHSVNDNSTSTTANMTNFAPKSTHYCDSQPCLNNGTCRESNMSDIFTKLTYHCECSEEYFGPNCQNISTCHDGTQSKQCQNGGTCTSMLNETKCLCGLNFTGLFCENVSATISNFSDTDPCASSPCLNNGTCIKVSTTNFSCKCPPVWDGDKICSKKHNDVATFNCSTKCNNGGICKPDGNCDCINTGFTGSFCRDDVNECTSLHPCKNGSSCMNTNGSYECSCVSGYSGKNCTETMTVQQSGGYGETSSNVGAIVGGIFGALAFIGLVIGGVFLFRYVNRSRKLKGKYNPAKEEMNNASGNQMPLSTLTTGERLI